MLGRHWWHAIAVAASFAPLKIAATTEWASNMEHIHM